MRCGAFNKTMRKLEKKPQGVNYEYESNQDTMGDATGWGTPLSVTVEVGE